MRKWFVLCAASAMLVAGGVVSVPESAEARCYTFQASHNGTDMFNPDGGAAGTATDKLMYAIETWKQEKRLKRVRVGKVKTKCGEWYIMYLLPHRTCTARARVCS